MSVQIIESYPLSGGDIWELNPYDTYILQTYTIGDWSGETSAHIIISATSGYANLSLPQNISATYIDFKNIHVTTYKIFAPSATCNDLGGNNSNIIFGEYIPSVGDVKIDVVINGVTVNVVKIYIDGMVYIAYVSGTDLMVDRAYFDNINNIIGTNATIV